MLTCSCPCAHHEDIWKRGVTTPHIIKPVLLHNMPRDNIRPTISSITFLLHISLPIKWNKCLFHSLHILVSLFLWVMIFGQTYPHSLALSGTLVLHEYVRSASKYTCFTFGENALSTNWTGGRMGLMNILTLPETLPQLLIHPCRPQPANHTNCTITVTLIQSVLSWIYVVTDRTAVTSHMCYSCNRLSVQRSLLICVTVVTDCTAVTSHICDTTVIDCLYSSQIWYVLQL